MALFRSFEFQQRENEVDHEDKQGGPEDRARHTSADFRAGCLGNGTTVPGDHTDSHSAT